MAYWPLPGDVIYCNRNIEDKYCWLPSSYNQRTMSDAEVTFTSFVQPLIVPKRDKKSLYVCWIKPGSESDQTGSESQRTLVRVTEAPLGESKKEAGCTWYAPPLAQVHPSSCLSCRSCQLWTWQDPQGTLDMQQLLHFLPPPFSSIPIHPPVLKWKICSPYTEYTHEV